MLSLRISVWKADGHAQDIRYDMSVACLFPDPIAKTQTNQLISLQIRTEHLLCTGKLLVRLFYSNAL